jgi:hypothetical protein
MPSSEKYYGQNRPMSATDPYNARWFLIDRLIKRVNTATLVQVKSITNTGTVAAVGTMDVQPMVHMIDGAGQISEHGTIRSILYARLQAGDKAVIMDPKPGDIGIAVFADRDTSAVRKNKKPSQPGSRRRFDYADGVYLMTLLGDKPKSYAQFMDDGTVVVGNEQESSDNPFQAVVGKNFVQIKQKGVPSMHVTVDGQSGQIIVGQATVIGPDPYPNY